jgi:hypothetical protein
LIVLADNKTVPLGRMLFVEKQSYTKEQLLIEASGPYNVIEKDDCFVIRNIDCCRAISVTVKVTEG